MHFGILGPLTVDTDAGRVEITAPKQRALLILLLINAGQVVSPDVILDRLWPDDPPSGGVKTVRFHVSRLRAALEPDVKGGGFEVVETRDPGYVIDADAHDIDIRRFETLSLEGHRAVEDRPDRARRLLTDALALWRGQALHDVAYEEFASAEIHRLEGLRRHAIEDRIAAELRLGRTAGLVAELERLAADDPLQERTIELLMQALYAEGRTADAVAVGQDLRRRLGELGLEPQPSLVLLEEQILLHDAGLTAPTAPATVRPKLAALPGRLSSFIGREVEIGQVAQAVERRRLVTLVGPPGAGKTSLALEVGRSLRDRFDEQVVWVGLGDLTDVGLVPQAFSTALGLVAPPGADYTELVIAELGTREVLLVVDNCEHVLDEAAQTIVAILEACPRVRILDTSREVLGAPGEYTWTVPPFELPPRFAASFETVSQVDSVRLFVDRAQDVDGRFALSEDNVDDVAEICRRLDGLPLAIELAASATEALSIRQIGDRLARRFAPVPSAVRHGALRQTTMESAVQWSFDLLSPLERTVFMRLSVFAGGFTMEAAEVVAGSADLDPDQIFDVVLHLVHKSLLIPGRPDDASVRYGMLAVLRQFGRRELEASGDAEAIEARHADYYTTVATSIAPYLEGASASRGRDVADRELDNFRTAMESSLAAGRVDVAMAIDAALTWHWYWRSYIAEGLRWGTRVLAAAEDTPTPARAEVTYAVGIFETILGDYALGHASFAQAGEMARAIGMEELEARSLTGRGVNARDRGHLASAFAFFREAEAIDRRIDDVAHLALTLRFVGLMHYMLGDLDAANRALDEAYALFEREGHRGGMGWAMEGKARVAFRAGNGQGYRFAEQAAELYTEVHDRRNRAWLLIRTGSARLLHGDFRSALADVEESAAIFSELSDQRGLAYARQQRGLVDLLQGEDASAEGKLRECLGLFEKIGEDGGGATTHGWLAGLALRRRDLGAVAKHCDAWLALSAEDRYVWATRDVLGYLADAADALLGGPNPARSAFEALDRALTDGAGVAEAVAGLDALPAPLRAALADRG